MKDLCKVCNDVQHDCVKKGVSWKRSGRLRTKVEEVREIGQVYAFPDFGGRQYRYVPESDEEDAPNAIRSRLVGLIDFEAVARANAQSVREAEREAERTPGRGALAKRRWRDARGAGGTGGTSSAGGATGERA